MEETKLSPVEFCIFRYLLANEGHTVIISDVARTVGITYQTASKYINAHINCGNIQRDGRKFVIVNPYIREVVANG